MSISVTKRMSRHSHRHLNRGIMRFSCLVLRFVAAFVSVLDIPCLRRCRGRAAHEEQPAAAGAGRVEDCLAPRMGTFCADGDIPAPTGTIDAAGDRIPVPQRAPCPRPGRHAPSRAERPHQDTPCAVGNIPVPPGTIDAAGDRNPVPQRASCPRPGRHAPSRAECPRRAPLRRCRTTWAVPGGPVAGTGRRPVGCGRAC